MNKQKTRPQNKPGNFAASFVFRIAGWKWPLPIISTTALRKEQGWGESDSSVDMQTLAVFQKTQVNCQ